MFKVILSSWVTLILLASQAFATGVFYCESCSTPYTANGQQIFSNFDHNLAWGATPTSLSKYGNEGAWDVRIYNANGRTITVQYRPSLWRIVQKSFGMGAGSIEEFNLVLPNKRVIPVKFVYRPGQDHKVFDPDNSALGDSSYSVGGGGGFNFVGAAGFFNFSLGNFFWGGLKRDSNNYHNWFPARNTD